MSVRQMSRVWEESPCEGAALLVHLALADFANDDGIAYPSQTTVARKARCTVKWVRKVMARLVDGGFLEQVEEGGGRGHTSRWRLIWKPPTEFPVSGDKGELGAPKGGTTADSVLLDEPSIEPPLARTRSARRPSKPFPSDWTPGTNEVDASDRVGMTLPTRRVEFQKFKDHHLAKGTTMVDWPAAWRTWCGNWVTFGSHQASDPTHHDETLAHVLGLA